MSRIKRIAKKNMIRSREKRAKIKMKVAMRMKHPKR
jgi:hypothetical protein